MRSVGLPELLIVAVFIFLITAPIWLSRKVKPIGGKPYLWGNWIAISHGLIAVTFSCGVTVAGLQQIAQNDPGVVMRLFLVLQTLLLAALSSSPFALVGIGLLQRRRFGVVIFLTMQILGYVLGL